MPYCTNCGGEVQGDWKACPSCGQPDPQQAQAKPDRASAQGSNALLEWMKGHKALTAILGVLLLIVVIAAFAGEVEDEDTGTTARSQAERTEAPTDDEAPEEELDATGPETFDGTTVSRTFAADTEWDEVAFFRDSYREAAELIPTWLKAYPDAEDFRITWEITLIDQYGAESDETGAEVYMARPVAERIQWDNMARDRLYRLAQAEDGITYRLHPAVLREIEFE